MRLAQKDYQAELLEILDNYAAAGRRLTLAGVTHAEATAFKKHAFLPDSVVELNDGRLVLVPRQV